MKKKYRKCVGMMILNSTNKILVGRRIDHPSGYWQMPQGGIDENEEPLEAALRELKEEINTANVEILAESKNWYTYDLPKNLRGELWKGKYKGQNQKWFAMKYLGDDNQIQPQSVEKPEFNDWKWIDIEDLPRVAIKFKQDIYRSISVEFYEISKSLKENFNLL